MNEANFNHNDNPMQENYQKIMKIAKSIKKEMRKKN